MLLVPGQSLEDVEVLTKTEVFHDWFVKKICAICYMSCTFRGHALKISTSSFPYLGSLLQHIFYKNRASFMVGLNYVSKRDWAAHIITSDSWFICKLRAFLLILT